MVTKNGSFMPERDESRTYSEEKPTKSGLHRPYCPPNGWLNGQKQLVLTSFPQNSHRVSTHGGISEQPYIRTQTSLSQNSISIDLARWVGWLYPFS